MAEPAKTKATKDPNEKAIKNRLSESSLFLGHARNFTGKERHLAIVQAMEHLQAALSASERLLKLEPGQPPA